MFTRFTVRWGIALCVLVAGVIAVVSIGPGTSTQAANDNDRRKGLFERTSTLPDDYPRYWDIREQKGEEISQLLEKYRLDTRRDAAAVADIRDTFVRGEQ